MPKKTLPRIVAVKADRKPLTLRVRWDKADESRIDVASHIEIFQGLRAIAPFAGIVRERARGRTRH